MTWIADLFRDARASRSYRLERARLEAKQMAYLEMSARAGGIEDFDSDDVNRGVGLEQRRAAQLRAIDLMARTPVWTEEDTPEYDQEPTASRQTMTDTDTTTRFTPLKETEMPALHNRALALKLAVEHIGSFGDGDDYALVLTDGEGIDESLLRDTLALADRFVTYLGADEPRLVPSGDTATTSAPARDAVADIRDLLLASRENLGGNAVNAALAQLPRLQEAARGQSYEDVVNTAITFVNSEGRAAYGAVVADSLATRLRGLIA